MHRSGPHMDHEVVDIINKPFQPQRVTLCRIFPAREAHSSLCCAQFLLEFGILAFDQRADYRPYKEVIPSEFVMLDNKTFYCSVNNSICAEFSF